MKTFTLITFMLILPLLGRTSVIYDFSYPIAGGATIGFTYTASDYLSGSSVNLSVNNLFACNTSAIPNWACTGATLRGNSFPNGLSSLSVTLDLINTTDPHDAFSTDEVYDTFPGAMLSRQGAYQGFLSNATLRIQSPIDNGSVTPEPSTGSFLLLPGGFAFFRLFKCRKRKPTNKDLT